MEKIFNLSSVINGIGIISAKYKEIKELFTKKGENYLMPQRLENFEEFLFIISRKTGIEVKDISYITPLWTYKVLTLFSTLMITWEIFAFKNQMLSMLNL